MTDLYATLGVARGAETADIKRVYRRLSKRHHPDAGGEAEAFHAIQTAYRVLTDDAMRADYDATGKWNETQLLSDGERAVQLLATIYAEMVKAANLDRHTDLKKLMMAAMESRRGQIGQVVADATQRVAFLETLIGRLPKIAADEGDSVFDRITRDGIRELDTQIAGVRDEERVLALAIEEMTHYDSLFEAAAAIRTFTSTVNTESRTTTGGLFG